MMYFMHTAYLLLHTKHGKNRLVYTSLKKHEEIIEIHELFGRYDLLVKTEAETLDDLKKFIQNKIWLTEGIGRAETLITADSEKCEEEPLVDDDDIDDDDFDMD